MYSKRSNKQRKPEAKFWILCSKNKKINENWIENDFKRDKWRPTNINLKKINNIRPLFAVKFLKETSAKTLTINIDESSLNRDIKTRYS